MMISALRRGGLGLVLALCLGLMAAGAIAAPSTGTFDQAIRPSHEAFVDAAANGNMDIIAKFLDSGMDVEARNQKGLTPLMAAAMGGHSEAVMLLAQAGADLDARDPRGYTVMELARLKDQLFIVDMLKRLGATDSKWARELIIYNDRL